MLERWKRLRCVQLDDTDRLICNMTLSGQVMTLTWGQIFKLTFQGQVIVHSMRLDERNTMLVKASSYKAWVKSYCKKTVSEKIGYFCSFCPLQAKPLTLGQIWENYSERALIGLSNALFRGAVALLVPELCVGFLEIFDIRPGNRRNFAFNDLWWPDLWPDQKIDRSDFLIIFDALSNAAFRVSLRGPGAELEGGVFKHPPPSRAWKSRTPSRARVSSYQLELH